mmetsp:Transcript_27357/g.45251  ORF Transcript_27357/g.45251 Transcript_27357/m.45251 type:complete len:80 (+) Transcript_27357:327-566(+)
MLPPPIIRAILRHRGTEKGGHKQIRRKKIDTEAGTLQIAHNDGPLKPATSGLEGKDLYLALGMGPECSLQLEDAYSDCG